MTFMERVEYVSGKTGIGALNAAKLLNFFGKNVEDTMDFWEKFRKVHYLGNISLIGDVGLTKLVLDQQEEIKDLKRRIEQLEEEIVMKELI